jgi:ABC-type molybdate transport system substrate-binding protein
MGGRTTTTRRLVIALLCAALVPVLGLLGCSGPAAEKPAATQESTAPTSLPVTQLRIYADESLKGPLEQTKPSFEKLEGLQVVFTFGPSTELRAAIDDGAAADAFISADPRLMEGLIEAGAVVKTASQDIATGDGDVRYVAAPLLKAEHRALGSIYALYLKSPQVQKVLADAGFGPPAAAAK